MAPQKTDEDRLKNKSPLYEFKQSDYSDAI